MKEFQFALPIVMPPFPKITPIKLWKAKLSDQLKHIFIISWEWFKIKKKERYKGRVVVLSKSVITDFVAFSAVGSILKFFIGSSNLVLFKNWFGFRFWGPGVKSKMIMPSFFIRSVPMGSRPKDMRFF